MKGRKPHMIIINGRQFFREGKGYKTLDRIKKQKAGKRSRTKGHSFERLIANRLKEIDPSCKRNMNEPQVAGHDINTRLPFGIQCKRLKAWISPQSILNQAAQCIGKGQIPLGIIKIDQEPEIFVVMEKKHADVLWYGFESKFHVVAHKNGKLWNDEWRNLKYQNPDWQIPIVKKRYVKKEAGKETYITTIYVINFEDWFKQVSLVYKSEIENSSREPQHQSRITSSEGTLTLPTSEA